MVSNIDVAVEAQKDIEFCCQITEVNIDLLLKSLIGKKINLPPELPEIKFKNIDISLNILKKTLSFKGEAEFIWNLHEKKIESKAYFLYIKKEGAKDYTCELNVQTNKNTVEIIKGALEFRELNFNFF